MASRCVVLISLLHARRCWVTLEQPAGSLMIHHVRFQQMIAKISFFVDRLELGRFGAPSTKAILMYSNRAVVTALRSHYILGKSPKSPGLVERLGEDARGVMRVRGIEDFGSRGSPDIVSVSAS
jgi:hypothetical protein